MLQGFLRSDRSLIQTIGRAARNANGHVIMYADNVSDAMRIAITETKRRRNIQDKYNKDNGIVPKTIVKEIRDLITNEDDSKNNKVKVKYSKKEKENMIKRLHSEMMSAAKNLDFERASELRDIMFELESE